MGWQNDEIPQVQAQQAFRLSTMSLSARTVAHALAATEKHCTWKRHWVPHPPPSREQGRAVALEEVQSHPGLVTEGI